MMTLSSKVNATLHQGITIELIFSRAALRDKLTGNEILIQLKKRGIQPEELVAEAKTWAPVAVSGL